MRKLFGTSGIRGLLNVNLTPSLALKCAIAFANIKKGGVIALGCDQRLPSKAIYHAVLSGLISGGVDVVDLGVVPTPALLHYVKTFKLDGAIMVTGSHTPPEITGILFFDSDTGEIDESLECEIEKMVFNEEYKVCNPLEVGRVYVEEKPLEAYIKDMRLSFEHKVDLNGERIVIDCANGPQSLILPEIICEFGGEPIVLNGNLDPLHKGRDPYPTPQTLKELGRKVVESKATLGVGVDGDGDRVLFSDEKGKVYWGDIIGCIFAEKAVSEKGYGAIICPVNTSKIVEDISRKMNFEIIYTKVGPPAIVKAIRENYYKVAFAFEETGKYIWVENILYGDPAYATLKMYLILKEEGKSLSEITAKYPKYHMLKLKLKLKQFLNVDEKGKLMEDISGKLKEEFKDRVSSIWTIDGVRMNLKDGSWILVRFSGTEPVLRIYGESKDEHEVRELVETAKSIVQYSMREYLA